MFYQSIHLKPRLFHKFPYNASFDNVTASTGYPDQEPDRLISLVPNMMNTYSDRETNALCTIATVSWPLTTTETDFTRQNCCRTALKCYFTACLHRASVISNEALQKQDLFQLPKWKCLQWSSAFWYRTNLCCPEAGKRPNDSVSFRRICYQ
jgi:hypothetical protein